MKQFAHDQIVRHAASGKLYRVNLLKIGAQAGDVVVPSANGRVCVFGQRNGSDFGPVRFVDASKLESTL
jgi:hypothetical protein